MDIRVENLSAEVTEQYLIDLFEEFGQLDSIVFGEREISGEPERFAVASMPFSDQGRSAIRGMDGRKLRKLPLSVTEIPAVEIPSPCF